MVQTRNRRGGPHGGRGKRRKTPQAKKPTGWIRGTSGIRTPDGKILSKSDIKSILLSSREAVAKRRVITAAEYGRVWQAMPETLLSLIEKAAGGVAKLQKVKQAGGLKLLAAAAETWLETPPTRVTRQIQFEDEHAASDEDADEAGAATCLVDGNLSGDGCCVRLRLFDVQRVHAAFESDQLPHVGPPSRIWKLHTLQLIKVLLARQDSIRVCAQAQL